MLIDQTICGSILLLLLTTLGCSSHADKSTNTSHEKPAIVERLPMETELARITLSEDAVRRLGIQTQPVVMKHVAARRTLGGEAIVPAGSSIIISAPVPGMVSPPADQPIPQPGQHVDPGQQLLTLVPMLSPERDVPTPAEQVQLVGARANLVAAQTVALGDVQRSRAEVNAAKIALDRAQKLFQDRAGPRRAVDDAEAQLNIAQSVNKAAMEREKQLTNLLTSLKQPSDTSQASGLQLAAPIGGIINRLNVSPGQTVASGAVLIEVINLDSIWIRVPVFVDLLPTIRTDQNARLVSLTGDRRNSNENVSIDSADRFQARPVAAPPTADPMAASADLYYEVDNRSLGLRPGQRIGVELPLGGESEALIVPPSSIVFDIQGGAWVYVNSGERQYTRGRVSIRWVDEDQAVLAAGPKVGTQVVVAGAAELFGTEFGAGK